MTKTAQRKPAYRLWWFWLLVLGLVYLVAGFGVIPLYLSSAIPERFQQHLGWTTDVGDVGFNPFTFSFSVEDLSATDSSGQRVLDVEAFNLNLGLIELIRGTVHVEYLDLDNPYLRVDRLEDNRINLIEDWQAQQKNAASADDSDAGESGYQVVFDEAMINGGRVEFRDFTRNVDGETREIMIDSLGVTVSDVASHSSDEPGEYSLQAVMDKQVLDWSGTLSLQPLWSNGRLTLSNVSAVTLQQWLGHHLPWTLQDGRISLSTAFQFAYDEQGVALATRDGQVTARRLALSDPQQAEETLVTAGNLSLDGVAFNLEGPELVVSMVQGQELHLNAIMSQEGQLNLTRAIEAMADNDSSDSHFRWSVGNLGITGSTIDWQDNRPASPVSLALQDLELTLGAMTEQLEEPISYQLRTSLAEGGTASANGQFTLHPLTFEGGINLDQLALVPFNGYVQQVSQMEIQDGTLNLAGNIDIDVQDAPLTGTFSGRGSISHFNARLPEEEEPVVVWRELRLDPIEYNFAPARLEIGSMMVSEPELNVINYRNQPHNVTRLVQPLAEGLEKGRDSATAAETESTTDDNADEGLIFRLSQLELSNAEIRYTDHTPQPAFVGRLHDLQASVSGLSNITPQQGHFTVKGMMNDSGRLDAEGTIATLGSDEPSQIDVTMDGLSMPVLSPYFAFYLGYRVDGGKLSSEGSYTLRGTRIESNTTLTLDRVELGEAVQSDTSVTAPVELGLTLLRDGNNRVTLDLPVNGDLASPDFDMGPVMMKTLRSVLVKAAMSPFNLLGSVIDLAGFTAEELGEVAFLPGETTLVMGEYTKMESVAKALKSRRGLVLAIRGRAVETVDLPALESALAEDETVPEGALDGLASQRGQTLKRLLMDEYEVDASQIFVRAHQVEPGEGNADQVTIGFELESR